MTRTVASEARAGGHASGGGWGVWSVGTQRPAARSHQLYAYFLAGRYVRACRGKVLQSDIRRAALPTQGRRRTGNRVKSQHPWGRADVPRCAKVAGTTTATIEGGRQLDAVMRTDSTSWPREGGRTKIDVSKAAGADFPAQPVPPRYSDVEGHELEPAAGSAPSSRRQPPPTAVAGRDGAASLHGDLLQAGSNSEGDCECA